MRNSKAAMSANLLVEIKHPNGRITKHKTHNTVVSTGLNFAAQKLAGDTSQTVDFEDAWSLLLDGSNTATATRSFKDNTTTVTASYRPTSNVNWSGVTLQLRVGASNIIIATAGAGDFTPNLGTTASGSQITFTWVISITSSGKVVSGITGGSPYLPATHQSSVQNDMMFVLRGLTTQRPFNRFPMVYYSLSQEPNPADPQDLTDRRTVETVTISRNNNVLSWMWQIPSATGVSEGLRERVFVPTWNGTPTTATKAIMPQAASGTTTEVSLTLTLSDG